MHWSDQSIKIDKYLVSHLGCDKYLLWGREHRMGVEGSERILKPTGYVFKRFIHEVRAKRGETMSRMGIEPREKVISFFDESFGRDVMMTESHYVTFWQTALKLAEDNPYYTVIMKTKDKEYYKDLSHDNKKRFLEIKEKIETMPNIYVVDGTQCSFIEVIGVSDIVVTQGMTSSATIAIICGIEGLYFDEVGYDHPFARDYREKLVFNDQKELLRTVKQIATGAESPLGDIPEDTLTRYDAYRDDRGIERFRKILTCYKETEKGKGITQ